MTLTLKVFRVGLGRKELIAGQLHQITISDLGGGKHKVSCNSTLLSGIKSPQHSSTYLQRIRQARKSGKRKKAKKEKNIADDCLTLS
jgi:hypothetical protein